MDGMDRLATIVCVVLATCASAQAQSANDGFDPGANADVYAVAVQTDGKVLVGGAFTTLGGGGTGTTARNRIGRLNVDGSIDTSFDPGSGAGPAACCSGSFVWTIAVQTDGKILVGGDFTTLGGSTRNRIGRLNADGSLDTSFNPSADATVQTLVVQSDGKILVAGAFTTLNGSTRNRIGRLNADGSLDTGFDPGADSTVYALAVQTDGKIVVGGQFTTLGGGGTGRTTRFRIGRLNVDGSLDAFNPNLVDSVRGLAIQADGKIVFGAAGFTTTPSNKIGRLNVDGSRDTSFDPGANGEAAVLVVAVQPDGKILVGGTFSKLGGGGATPRNRLGRLNADGSLDALFDPGANDIVYALAVQPDGKIVVGGRFTNLGGGGTGTTARARIGRLYGDGSLETDLTAGPNGNVLAIGLQPDG